MDLLSFIQTVDPIKVRIGERQRAEGEPKLLDTTKGRVVLLLLVAPARASSELEASVDKLFDEGGSGSHAKQGDSVSCGHGVGVPQVSETAEIVAEDAAHLKEDHGTSTGPSVGGKSRSMLQRLLAEAVLNPEVRVVALPTLPFITSFVSVTPEREDGDRTDFMAGANLRTITAPPRFVISSDSSHHSGANIAEAKLDSFATPSASLMTMTTTVTSMVDLTTTAKEKFIEPFIFGGGSSFGAQHTVGGFSGLTGSDFIVGGIRTVVSPDTDLQKVYVPQWSVTNSSCLDDGRTCREMVDVFAPPKFFASIHGMEHDELFTEFNVGAARQISLNTEAKDEEVASLKAQLLVKEAEAAEAIRLRAEVQALADHNTVLEGEKSELDVKVANLVATVKVREQEVADLDGVVTSVKVYNDNLSDQDDQIKEMNEKFDKLDTDLVELSLHLEDIFYPRLLTTIYGRRWLLTHGLELAIAKCLNSTEYLSSLEAAIGKAVKKGMQEGLSAGITYGAAGRVLTDVAAYNPSAEADYLSTLQHSLAERLGLTKSQPRVDQLMVPIHHSPNQRIIGAFALSLSSALCDVFVPPSEPLSAIALTGMEVISATIDTPTAPSTTLAFVSTITPIFIEDYEVAGTDGQEAVNKSVPNDATGGNVNPFPNVDDVELNVSQ
ncbi:hypothetical protein Tco_0024403 [Tanacetum coccineum]